MNSSVGLTPEPCSFAAGGSGQSNALQPYILQPSGGGFPVGSTHVDMGAESGVCDPSRGDVTLGEPPGQHANGNQVPASSWRFEPVFHWT